MFLKFSNPHHFKYGKENPKIIGFELHAVDGDLHGNIYPSSPIPCFKVQFESSEEIDYIPHESVTKGFWQIIW